MLSAKSICFVSVGASVEVLVQVAEGEELTVDYNYPDSVQLPWYRYDLSFIKSLTLSK